MGKINAKKEFIEITKGFKIIAAYISFDTWKDSDVIKLNPLYSDNEYDIFIKNMDREYDDGYGSQNLFGTIYCEDNVWMTRVEYDGSEWWIINKCPNMRDSFDDVDILKYERSKKLKNISYNQ